MGGKSLDPLLRNILSFLPIWRDHLNWLLMTLLSIGGTDCTVRKMTSRCMVGHLISIFSGLKLSYLYYIIFTLQGRIALQGSHFDRTEKRRWVTSRQNKNTFQIVLLLFNFKLMFLVLIRISRTAKIQRPILKNSYCSVNSVLTCSKTRRTHGYNGLFFSHSCSR